MTKSKTTSASRTSPCPDAEQLAAFVDGLSHTKQHSALEEHVDSCHECRTVVALMARDNGGPFSRSPARDADGPIEAPELFLSRGDVVGRYTILERCGAGAMGVVYAAYDSGLDRKIALKILRAGTEPLADDARQQRLVREARAMARISHPNTVTVHDVGTLEGRVFVAMEFVAGQTAREWLNSEAHSVADILTVFEQAGRGLAAAHANGLVHRDFKPENVLVGSDGRVRVADFGLARWFAAGTTADDRMPSTRANMPVSADLDLTRTGARVGTPAYMSPEQLRGAEVAPYSDQFSFCAALHEALTGARPFTGASVDDVLKQIESGDLRDWGAGPAVSKEVRAAIKKGLASQPEDRHPSMEVLLKQLRPPTPRRLGLVIAGVTIVTLALVSAGLFWRSTHREALCRGGAEKLNKVWGPHRIAAAGTAFASSEVPGAQEAWRTTERVLADYAEQWQEAYYRGCAATHLHGDQSAALLDRRMSCLRRGLYELDALGRLLAEPDETIVSRAAEAAFGLPDPEACDDPAAWDPLSPPDEMRSAIESLRADIAELRALDQVGKSGVALERATRLPAVARETGYAPGVAEALGLLGELRMDAGQWEEASAALREAVVAAEACDHDSVKVLAWIRLGYVERLIQNRPGSDTWLDLAEAAIQRNPGLNELAALLHGVRGLILWRGC